ncbi:hydrogenase subunit MbhD domain-containing protein [Vreelandella olivaria]|uniref:hydrogenase subunit MbhD domain-containing protein n=1 Tax=Vreelandella olivaria TaxID=390919 RepID=UPI00201ED69D|nr:hydrogenase subunit MbhD domain-containing protein [Halomonas olivaria]
MLVVDLLLALAALATAGQCLLLPGLFRAVANLMAFGLVMALIWVRLEAPDVALAEAAIGAGITGALLLTALGQLPASQRDIQPARDGLPRRIIPITILVLLITGMLWAAILGLPKPGLVEEVATLLPESGAEHAVTALLLNLRGIDTLLEITVMLCAVATIWSLQQAIPPPTLSHYYPGLPTLARWLHPLFLLMFSYFLWQGTHAPGGAFPAGALLGAGGVLLLLTGSIAWMYQRAYNLLLRWLLAAGLLLFLITALAGLLMTGTLYGLPPRLAGYFIIAIEVATALSITLMLMTFYLFGRPGAQQ